MDIFLNKIEWVTSLLEPLLLDCRSCFQFVVRRLAKCRALPKCVTLPLDRYGIFPVGDDLSRLDVGRGGKGVLLDLERCVEEVSEVFFHAKSDVGVVLKECSIWSRESLFHFEEESSRYRW